MACLKMQIERLLRVYGPLMPVNLFASLQRQLLQAVESPEEIGRIALSSSRERRRVRIVLRGRVWTIGRQNEWVTR